MTKNIPYIAYSDHLRIFNFERKRSKNLCKIQLKYI